jgi:hypothetical protein
MFCYQKNFSNPTLPVDEAQFYALVRAGKWNEAIDQYRKTGEASLKRKLPAFIFQATFDETTSKAGKVGAWRKQAATRLTGLVVMDVDHVEDPKGVFDKWGLPPMSGDPSTTLGMTKGALGMTDRILLVYITPSGKGLKVVFKADVTKGNLIDNQHAMAKVLGVEVDESCKDASRMSFICKESDILFIDKELFTYENKAFAEKYEPEYRANHSGATKTDVVASESVEQGAGNVSQMDDQAVQLSFKGRPYSEIIDEWWKHTGGVPQEGERNVKLYQLAVNLRAICDNNKALLMQVMPRLGLDEQELHAIVESACKEPPKGLSKPMREILAPSQSPLIRGEASAPPTKGEMERVLWDWGEKIEVLFDEYPMLKDICEGLKPTQFPAAVFVGGGFLMTLMTRMWYRFYHRPEQKRRLNASVLIIGDPASGKSFATQLYELFAAPIIAADKAGLDAVNRWKEETEAKGANKDKQVKPKCVIRIHPSRTSNATFIQDMVNAVEIVDGEKIQLHMLTFDTELDNSIQNQKGGSWIDKQSLELKAFHNEEDGQAYSNKGSVQGNFNVTWNFVYTGTPLALKKKVNERNFGSGLSTRLTTIPLPPTNFEMMALSEYKTFDQERFNRMKDWAVKLDATKGELTLWEVVKYLWSWTARRMADAAENDSKAEEMLLKRCAYHGLNFAAPFIVMRHWNAFSQDGKFWCGKFTPDATDCKLAELLCNIQYICQKYFYGALAEKYFDDMNVGCSANHRHHQKTVDGFNRLPKVFTLEDIMECFGYDRVNTAEVKVKRLRDDQLVVKLEADGSETRYEKVNQMMI